MIINEQQFHSLDTKLSKKCEQAQIPGMSLVVSKDGQPIYKKNYGYRHVEKQKPITVDTVLGIASLTKSIACLAIMQLEDASKLAVSDPVIKWLPEFEVPNKLYRDQIKIHHLMTHTSGFPGMTAINQGRAKSIKRDPDGAYLFGEIPSTKHEVHTVMDLMKIIAEADYTLLGRPGEAFNYSNESYALLQEIIERASKQSFIDYVQSHIFNPLQMDRSTFLISDLKEMENVTELYAFNEGKTVFHSPAWWDVGAIYANGALKSTTSDLMKYLEVYRLNGTVNGVQIASKISIEKMMMSQYITPNDLEYGYGLLAGDYKGINLVGHGGSLKGVSSYMLIAKELGITVAALTNIADVGAQDLALTALSHLLDLPEQTDSNQVEYKISKDKLAQYTGLYKSGEGHVAEVYMLNEDLYLLFKDSRIKMVPYAENQFIADDGKKFAFVMNDDNEVAGIFRGMRFIPKKE